MCGLNATTEALSMQNNDHDDIGGWQLYGNFLPGTLLLLKSAAGAFCLRERQAELQMRDMIHLEYILG